MHIPPLETLIHQYGYLALLVGTFLEGETIVILAGIAAHRGYLDIRLVALAALVGSFCGDQFYFYIGKWKGQQFLYRYDKYRSRVDRVRKFLYKHQNLLILGFRFVYGVRNVTPFVLGAAGVGPMRYLVLNALGAAVWALSFSLAGYYFGKVVEQVLEQFKLYEMYILGGLAAAAATAWIVRQVRQGRKKKAGPGA
jgi:membrane protein DedA with SNARE-associated domain